MLGRPVTVNGTPILEWLDRQFVDVRRQRRRAQSNKLQGNITVTVAKRLSNGNLVVRGQKWIAHQPGPRVRAHPGRRPPDRHRSPTTPSVSYKVADATISYGGQGTLADANQAWAGSRASSTPRGRRSEQDDLMDAVSSSRLIAHCAICAASFLLLASPASAERVKDLASVRVCAATSWSGYGLVVGLDGTGDQTSQAPFTIQSIKNMLAQFGVTIPANANPQLKNVAAVTVNADLPPFAKPGQTIDVTVSSIGNAQACAAARC